ncbi:MAG: hypothetical protein HYS66_12270 [Deltaproteobacteria bacterium]|nr:hypothetical protein [Deltaproteobacteria bacterium]
MLGLLTLSFALASQSPDFSVLQDIQRSHIEANVPPSAEFNRILQRDLDSYVTKMRGKTARVEYEMLRDGPTQSGIAYPKFYVWVRVFEGASVVDQGAVRLAAIERREFQVTDFLSERAIRTDPKAIYRVFPTPVCERINSKLGIAK